MTFTEIWSLNMVIFEYNLERSRKIVEIETSDTIFAKIGNFSMIIF